MEAYLDIAGWVVSGAFVVLCSMMLWQYVVVKTLSFRGHFLMPSLRREVQHRVLALNGEAIWPVAVTMVITFALIVVVNLPASEYISAKAKVLAVVFSALFLVFEQFRVLWKSLKEFYEAIDWAIRMSAYTVILGKVVGIRPITNTHPSAGDCCYVTVKTRERTDEPVRDLEFFVEPKVLGHGIPLLFSGEVIVLFDNDRSGTALFVTRP